MKTIIIAVFLYFCFYLNAQTEKKNAFLNKYIYATYCAGYTILNKDYVDKMEVTIYHFTVTLLATICKSIIKYLNLYLHTERCLKHLSVNS